MNPTWNPFLLSLLLTTGFALVADTTRSAEASDRGLLLVANKGDHTMGIIDPVAGRQIDTVAEEGITGHELVASADGKRAFVPIYGSGGVGSPGTDGNLMRVIDVAERKIIGTVDFGKGVRPHCAVYCAPKHLLYITTELDHSVTAVDPDTLKIVGHIPTGQAESHMLAVTRDGRLGYTSNVGPGTVSVLALDAKKVLAIIPVAPGAQRISLSVDDRWVFTSDQREPRLAVIDTETRTVARWVELPGCGYGTATTPDGRWLVAAIPSIHQVAVVDLQNMKVARTFDVPRSPQEVLIRPDGGVAFVSCDASHQVAVIDLKEWKVSKLIEAGHGVDGLAWAKAE